MNFTAFGEKAVDDPDLKQELISVADDSEGINDRFYRNLEFGTGGLRGVIGAGTNRMNIYTVRRATQGFADYINEAFDKPSVAIAYDSRIKSDVFAKAAAGYLLQTVFTFTYTASYAYSYALVCGQRTELSGGSYGNGQS